MQVTKAEAKSTSESIWTRPFLLPLIAASTALVAYCTTIPFRFVFDDEVVIVRNPMVQSWHYVAQYFTTLFGSHLGPGVISYYRPLFLLWFRINNALFGLNPAGFHLTAVLVHAAVTALVFVVGKYLLGNPRLAMFFAVLFGVHPVHVEDVSWISCASETLLGVSVLAAFAFWLKFRMSGVRAYLVASLVFYAAAMFEKEPGAVFPALIFSYAFLYSPEGESLVARVRKAAGSVLPFVPVAIVYLVARAVATKGMLPHATTQMSVTTMLMTLPSVLWFYLRSIIWPNNTSAFYDVVTVATPELRSFILPSIAVLCFVGALLVWAYRSGQHRREIIFALLWMAITISPALYIRMFLPNDFAHVRYLYLPSVGFMLLITLAGSSALHRLNLSQHATSVAILVCLVATAGTLVQQQYWANNLALYTRSVEIAPRNPTARNNLGTELMSRQRYEEAIAQYTTVLQDNPGFWLANYNIGLAWLRMKDAERAKFYLDRAIAISPIDPDEHFFRGAANLELGRSSEAIQDFERAASLDPARPVYRETAERVRREMMASSAAFSAVAAPAKP